MSWIYELIGRLVVGFVRWRYGREIRMAAGAGLALGALAIGAFIASREREEESV
jgi:hypothetical protein